MVKKARRSMEDEEEGDDVTPQILYVEMEATRWRLVVCAKWMGGAGGCAVRRQLTGGGGMKGGRERGARRMNLAARPRT